MIKSLRLPTMVVGLSLAGAALACSPDGSTGFVPANKMNIPVGFKGLNGGLTQVQFNNAIDKVVGVYSPIVSNLGARLVVDRKWTNGEVNAYAERSPDQRTWGVSMFGGLARHPSITEDAMSLVVCHEIGHHIGGAPKKKISVNKWSSAEGQADYFANLKCLRKVFLNDNNVAITATLGAPANLVATCKALYKNDVEDTALCVRMSMAGKSVAGLFADLARSPEARFETADRTVVASVFEAHPKAQCRLDTFFQAALCDVNMNEDVSQTDEVKGTCHSSLGQRYGVRPLCWFKPSR